MPHKSDQDKNQCCGIHFSQDECDVIYQYGRESKKTTLFDLNEILPVLKYPEIKAIVESTIQKLSELSDQDCVKWIEQNRSNNIQARIQDINIPQKEAEKRCKQERFR